MYLSSAGTPCPAEAFEEEGENAAHYCHWVSTSDECCNPDNSCSQEVHLSSVLLVTADWASLKACCQLKFS
eukprot:1099839-Pleurochrysis_carterae.AAC.1